MSIFRFPGPQCGSRMPLDIDDGTLVRQVSPIPRPLGFNCLLDREHFDFLLDMWTMAAKAAQEQVTDADKDEFKLLKGKITDKDVHEYVKHRNEFFGSRTAYEQYAAEADKELDDTKGLRKLIELQGQAQTIYYRWVRKAYQNAGVTDVPAIIKAGKSEKLKKALENVKAKSGGKFKSGGFNPRPKKSAEYRYRLGTLSDHALGTAIDIESDSNPILSLKTWAFIEKLADKKVDRRKSRWEKTPEALWKDIKELNDLFVKKVADELKRIEKEREAAKAASAAEGKTTAKKPQAPIDEVLAGHKDLKQWTGGFFTLEWKLVEQLHAHDFLWGATFTNAVDLHHFELS